LLKEFNVTGTCIPEMHYMVDISGKLDSIIKLIEKGSYFTINRPRQYGKTTTMFLLKKKLQSKYIVIRTSFEGIGDAIFDNEEIFSSKILGLLANELILSNGDLASYLDELGRGLKTLDMVSSAITKFVIRAGKKVVLMIDEVDKSSNNQLFLSFIGMLRNKYLKRNEGEDYSFQSVILAGVHDVKNLKLKLRPDAEKKYNSPWNIAVDFKVNMSFSPDEISTMLNDYSRDKDVSMDIPKISENLYYFTSGYPFLISRLCKIIDEEIIIQDNRKEWTLDDIEEAVQIILKEKNTNFDSLISNLENNEELYNAVFEIIIDGREKGYNADNPIINIGETYGIFREINGKLKIHNRIYEQRVYNYMSSKLELSTDMGGYNFRDNFINTDGSLDFTKILIKFQQFMKKEYSEKDSNFIERNGRLLFLAFIKPIINGRGFDFKEVQTSEERRLDVVVTYLDRCYVAELKMWYGKKAHEKGILQLCTYLDSLGLDRGYLIIYDTRRGAKKEWKQDSISIGSKEIYMVWV